MHTILVVNAGSSSVKFQVFAIDDAHQPRCLIKGQVDGIGTRPRLRAEDADKRQLIDQFYAPEDVKNVPLALHTASAWLRRTQQVEPIAVGHRVVHGGPEYDRPIAVDGTVLSHLERYVPLAPLHQPNNLAPISAIRARNPELLQVACFDTAFHRSHSALADHYALPQHFYAEGIRRYGFHGLSYEYVANRLQQIAPDIAARRVIVAHLGSGASMCALSRGRSVESTMGFTALDGLPMGTRPGQLDPGVVLHLAAQRRMAPADIERLLYHDCGLKGLSGGSNDVRDLLASEDPRARLALDYLAYRTALAFRSLAAAMGGVDGIVFTAGVGENAAPVRAAIVERCAWLGAELDPARNARNAPLSDSQVRRATMGKKDKKGRIGNGIAGEVQADTAENVTRGASW